ncbi:MAG: hypothetical protein NVSMB5_26870 [Candidatus Velthaea sp.]
MRYNHLAVIVSALAFFGFGAIWYTIFDTAWHADIGKSPEDLLELGYSPYIMSVVMAIIMAYGISTALDLARATNWSRGASVAGFLALVLFGTITLTQYTYEGRPIALTMINLGYGVFGAAITGGILGAWRLRKAEPAPVESAPLEPAPPQPASAETAPAEPATPESGAAEPG